MIGIFINYDKNIKNNIINSKFINVIYELYNLFVTNDILIENDIINVDTLAANFMMFNGENIIFNNYNVTFKNFTLNAKQVNSIYYYLAYDTSKIKDKVTISFINSTLSIYDNPKHIFIARDENEKNHYSF